MADLEYFSCPHCDGGIHPRKQLLSTVDLGKVLALAVSSVRKYRSLSKRGKMDFPAPVEGLRNPKWNSHAVYRWLSKKSDLKP